MARPLTDSEISSVLNNLKSDRNKCLFILGLKTGFRISELLSLTVKDVLGDRIKVFRRNTKGRMRSREIILHPLAVEFIKIHIVNLNLDSPLFQSRQGINKPLSRFGAHKILSDAYLKAGLSNCATHSMRKTFAGRVYRALKFDLIATRDALAHSSVLTTVKYLEVNRAEIDRAILAS